MEGWEREYGECPGNQANPSLACMYCFQYIPYVESSG